MRVVISSGTGSALSSASFMRSPNSSASSVTTLSRTSAGLGIFCFSISVYCVRKLCTIMMSWVLRSAVSLKPPMRTPRLRRRIGKPSSPSSLSFGSPMSATPAISAGRSCCTARATRITCSSSANRLDRLPASSSAATSPIAASATSMGCGFAGGDG